LLHYQARVDFEAYDASIKACAQGQEVTQPYICPPSESASYAPLRASGNRWQTGAIASYVGGGAALVTGAVLLYFNQPRLPPVAEGIAVAPVLTPGSAGVALAFDF